MKQAKSKNSGITFNYAQLAKDILNFRTAKNLTFTELEEITNVNRTTLYRLEAVKHKADIETILNVCKGIKKNVLKYAACIMFVIISLAASAQAKGQVNGVTVDLSACESNVAKVVLVDEKTGVSYSAYSVDGNLHSLAVPKKGVFTVWLYMYNNEETEINYWLDCGADWVGITMQPGEAMRGAGILHISLDRNATLTLYRR